MSHIAKLAAGDGDEQLQATAKPLLERLEVEIEGVAPA